MKKIVFAGDQIGGELITLFCNRPCNPELSSLAGEDPRVVMDMQGVAHIQTKSRNVNTGGKLVKRIRSYLDQETQVFRIVLDMEPSKNYIVCPIQDPFNNAYMVRIEESEQKPGERGGDKSSSPSPAKRIMILRPDLKPEEQQEGKPQEAGPGPEKRDPVNGARDVPTVEQGRSQLIAGEYAAAVDTFTLILAADPQDSLSYRLRGNAYRYLGDRLKSMEDWTRAARLGDALVQSYLDSMQVKWRENPAP
ncbi:MAG: hypothetical protein M1418_07040 [Deltaproteobacteria bacterium]|nr:hypothetical protein [Deltaproteobacteria bacterium]